jgi:hypothetical protein
VLLLQALQLLRQLEYILSQLLQLLLMVLLLLLLLLLHLHLLSQQLLLHLLLLLLLLLLQLCDLPLKIAHRVPGHIAAIPAFAEPSRPIRKRQQHVLGVIGQRTLHKHDALESGLDAGGLQPLHALTHSDARFVDGEKEGQKGEDVADDDSRLLEIREALELVGIQGRRHAGVASWGVRRRGEAGAAGRARGCAR